MKTSNFLKIVKRDHLAYSQEEFEASNKARYLCLAISDAYLLYTEYTHIGWALKKRIDECLDGSIRRKIGFTMNVKFLRNNFGVTIKDLVIPFLLRHSTITAIGGLTN